MKPIDVIKNVIRAANQPWLVELDGEPNSFVLSDIDGNIFAGIMEVEYKKPVRVIGSEQKYIMVTGWYAWVEGYDGGDYDNPPDYYDIEIGYYQRIEDAVRELVLHLIRGMIDNKTEWMFGV